MPNTGEKVVRIGQDIGGGTSPTGGGWSDEGSGVNPGNLGLEDGFGAQSELNQFADFVLYDNIVSLTLDASSESGDNKASGIALPQAIAPGTAYTSVFYGSSTDTWGLSLTPSDVNSTSFGAIMQWVDDYTGGSPSAPADGKTTDKLLARQFGFSIPSTAVIDGVVLKIKKFHEKGVVNTNKVFIDIITMTVYYTEPSSSPSSSLSPSSSQSPSSSDSPSPSAGSASVSPSSSVSPSQSPSASVSPSSSISPSVAPTFQVRGKIYRF